MVRSTSCHPIRYPMRHTMGASTLIRSGKAGIPVNAFSVTMVIVGIFLILVGVALLVIKVQTSESEVFKPIFQGPGRIMVSGPVGLVVIVIGVFCLIISAAVIRTANSNNSPSGDHHSQISVSAHSRPSAKLLEPLDGTQVSRSRGFTASGSAVSLGSETIWILDYDGGYTVDQEAAVAGGHWSATDSPLGDSSNHLPYGLTMVAALADPACASKFTRLNEGNNDYISKLPVGCKLFGEVTVDVAKP